MPLVTAADGARIYFERLGPSPSSQANGRLPLLLLAPLGLNGRLWQAAAHLAAEDGDEGLTIDNRGSGRSDSPRRPWTIGTIGHDVLWVPDQVCAPRGPFCRPLLGRV